VVGAEPVVFSTLRAIFSAGRLGKWRAYADEAWFQEHEANCETVLADFLQCGRDRTGPRDARSVMPLDVSRST